MKSNEQDITRFKDLGFTPANSNTIKKLRRRGLNFKKFDSGVFCRNGMNPKYNDRDLFGKRLTYYYDLTKEKEFVNFLVEKFFDLNPDPATGLRSVFTRILHYHKLCWYGCYHGGKRFLKN